MKSHTFLKHVLPSPSPVSNSELGTAIRGLRLPHDTDTSRIHEKDAPHGKHVSSPTMEMGNSMVMSRCRHAQQNHFAFLEFPMTRIHCHPRHETGDRASYHPQSSSECRKVTNSSLRPLRTQSCGCSCCGCCCGCCCVSCCCCLLSLLLLLFLLLLLLRLLPLLLLLFLELLSLGSWMALVGCRLLSPVFSNDRLWTNLS